MLSVFGYNTFTFITQVDLLIHCEVCHIEHMNTNLFQYSKKEELVNTFTHLFGVFLGIYFLVSLLSKAIPLQDISRIISNSIFGIALILLFLSSSIYHYTTNAKLKILFKRLDHSCIYLVIAATYTPFIMHHFDQRWTSTLLSIVWVIAGIGIIYKILAKKKRSIFSLTTYLGFGVIFFAIKAFVKMNMSDDVFNWLLIGGLFYIVGSIFYRLKKLPHHHGIWHLFVLGGVTSHYISLFYSVSIH